MPYCSLSLTSHSQFIYYEFSSKKNMLYHISRANFPHEFDPFVKVSQSFAAGPETAQFIFDRIMDMDTFSISECLPPAPTQTYVHNQS
jgi:hypothetical protein